MGPTINRRTRSVTRFRIRTALGRYSFAIAMVVAGLGLRLLLTPLTGRGAPFGIFFSAALVTSLVAGVAPALLAVAISLPLAVYVFVLPAGYPKYQALFQAALYAVNGLIIVYMTVLMRRAQSRVSDTIELAPDAYVLADLSARFTDVNQAASRLLGYERSELVGKTIFDLMPPDKTARLEEQRTALLTPGTVLTTEWALKRKDGTFVPVEVSANILRDGRWQAFVRDISERRRAETRLRESEERFRLTFDDAPIGMALVALDGRFERVNRVLCEITGYSADELTRLRFQDITHPDDLATDVEVARRLAAGEVPRYQLEKRYIRKDRSTVTVMLSVSILRDPDGNARFYISQIEDITARKATDEALKRAVAARDEVLGFVAHDLRNPLSAILMQASLLERPAPDPERRDQKAKELIVRSAKRMNRLIQDLLDVATIEAGRFKVEPSRLSASDLVREAVEAHAMLAASSNVELRLKVSDDVPAIWGDRNRLLQVFENLIGNAIKFTPAGGRITVAAASRRTDVLFSVADTGAGIGQESLAHIFDPFWQAATRERRLGAGLGLPITRGVVEAHGGALWVDSHLGQGSTFFFTIPIAPAEPRPPLESKRLRAQRIRRAKR